MIDTEPLELWEYQAIQAQLAPHWQLFYWLLWETGLRVSEALALTKADLQDTTIRIKRLKKREPQPELIPISLSLANALREHAQRVKGRKLFPFTRAGAWLALRQAARVAGLQRNIHPHMFRHSLAHRAAGEQWGLSPLAHEAVVQQMMGHSDPKYTRKYFQPTKAEVAEAWRKMHEQK